MKTSLQLWSLKDEMEENFPKTLEQVSEMGYDGVEFAGYFGYSAAEISQLLTKYHLQVSGSHIPLKALQENYEETVAFEKEIGNQEIIIPWLKCETVAEWQKTFKVLDQLAEQLKKEGLNLSYHNHGHEFLDFPGTDILALMYQTTHHLTFEVDVYWLAYAGVEVLTWLTQHQEKIAFLHFKDLTVSSQGEKESCELGKGSLPLLDYAAFSKKQNLAYGVVEQEQFTDTTPVRAARHNATYLKNLFEKGE